MSINRISSPNLDDLENAPISSAPSNGRARCAWCQKVVGRRAIVHSNPSFQDSKIYFCSRDCHNAWCYAQASKD